MQAPAADPTVRPWRLLLETVESAAADPAWTRAVPPPGPAADGRPMLDGVAFRIDAGHLQRWSARLLETAAASGGAAATLAGATERLDTAALFRAALGRDADGVRALATGADVDADALAAVAPLLPVPLLRACGVTWRARVPADRDRGDCPVCGAWPTLAEARGLERARQLRCGACGGDWRLQWLTCPYCGNGDHERLQALVPEAGGESRRVEACRSCRGYLKTFTTLTARSAADVLLTDLASIDLDVAALERGYQRPGPPAPPPDVRVVVSERRAWGLLGRR